MCGIAGAFFVRDPALAERFVKGALVSLAHRGPDDLSAVALPEGALGHRRLSILDPTPAGRQPFASRDGRVLVVHNGEIYNYLELRHELAELGDRFATDTDTEVIVAAYRRWGVDAVSRFNGIWAFALWDANAGRLLLSRDRLGVKPLYYASLDGGLAFASEIKALLPILPNIRPHVAALRDYAWDTLTDHADATFYHGIDPLPPGANLLLTGKERSLRHYWSITDISGDSDPRPQSVDDDRVEAFGELLRNAVKLQLRSDVAIGSCLSGGLDSSAIVAISSRLVAGRLGPHASLPRIAFTASFPGSPDDETARAGLVAATAAVEHRCVTLDVSDLIATLDRALGEQDEPFQSASIFAQQAVMKAASAEGIKVMLDGQGADELLAGYPHYRYPWLLGIAKRRPISVPARLRDLRRSGIPAAIALRQLLVAQFQLGASGRAPFGRDARPPAWMGPVLRTARPLPLRGTRDRDPEGTPLARQLRRALIATSLPALLRYEDRSSMQFGVEARVPYLDHRLVEAACLLPDRLRIERGATKVILRRAVEGIVPDEIRLEQRKIGFAVPQVEWLAASMPAIRMVFADSRAIREGVLDKEGIGTLLDQPLAADGGAQLWRAMSIELWLRRSI